LHSNAEYLYYFITVTGASPHLPEGLMAQLKPYRIRRKRLAALCLFLVLTAIILGVQVYESYNLFLTVILIIVAGLFAFRAYRGLMKYGWI